MKKILIASTNPGKIVEIKIGLQELKKQGIKILTLNDVEVGDKVPEETGKTFQENTLIKAKFYACLTHLPVLSDDGGLIIPYLNNEPGVKSRRWLGYEATDEELIKFALFNLRGCTGTKRTAFLETCLAFFLPMPGHPKGGQIFIEQEKIKGHIAKKASNRPINGYPYRALFIVDQFNKYYDELTPEENQKANHRLKALKRLTKRIEDLI